MAIVEYQISLGNETLCSKDRHPLLLKCFITSLRCIRMVVRASYQIYNPLMVNTLSFFTRTTLNFQPAKLPILGTRILILSLWNMTLYCKDKHPLLIESILASLRHIRICRGSLDSISDSLIWSSQHCLYQIYAQISSKMPNFEHQIILGDGAICHKDMHIMLLECFLTPCRCIRMVGRASGGISNPLMVNKLSFLPELLSNVNQNYQFWALDHQPVECDVVL